MLQWPKEFCDNCGYALNTKEPGKTEKGFSPAGMPVWTDFCGKCGRGYQVGTRDVSKTPTHPEPGITVAIEEEVIVDEIDELIKESSNLVMDPVPDSETEVADGDNGSQAEDHFIPDGYYYCPKCKKNHSKESAIGKKHLPK